VAGESRKAIEAQADAGVRGFSAVLVGELELFLRTIRMEATSTEPARSASFMGRLAASLGTATSGVHQGKVLVLSGPPNEDEL